MKMKIKNLKFLFLLSYLSLYTICPTLYAFAQEESKLTALTKQIIEAKSDVNLYPTFEKLKDLYFNDNKYKEFVEFLYSLAKQKKELTPVVNYYIALTRYSQLAFLEEKQNWDEYFSQGNAYRQELVLSAKGAADSLSSSDPFSLYARLLLWKFHKAQNDALNESSLSELINACNAYVKNVTDLTPIKDVANNLLALGEKAKAKEAYRIYEEKIMSSNIRDDELKIIAMGFYKDGNLDLAEAIYDGYIERIAKTEAKERLIPELTDIAKNFSFKDEGQMDPSYAAKIFNKIEALGGKEAFNQELMYLRALSLEKIKEYAKAKDAYLDLVLMFPETGLYDQAIFKVGIISTYILHDLKNGKSYFEKIAQKETPSPQVISSLYQLGLLGQWEEDYLKSKEYYNKLIALPEVGFQDTRLLTQERLKEIEEAKPMEHNLKLFLDASLKEEYFGLDPARVDLKSSPYKAKKDQDVATVLKPIAPASGCIEVRLQYLWSGDLGTSKPTIEEASFISRYPCAGTKVINVVVVSSAGIAELSLDMIDVE